VRLSAVSLSGITRVGGLFGLNPQVARSVPLVLLGATFLIVGSAQTAPKPEKSGDACAPPPNAGAPALPARILEGQGTVHFPITTSSPEAQKFFDQGIAQLHSFWATEAERSFLQAAELDPAAPMPWFGVAMAAGGDYRPRFQIDAQYDWFGRPERKRDTRAERAARKALELAAVPGKATELERLYIDAVAARRLETKREPEDVFVEKLRVLLAKYPKEVEARTYLALFLMRGFTMPDKKPRDRTSMEAVSILRDLLRDAPDHPGVHHYVIHGWEGSTFASDAWPSCKRYAELVPNIPHALHMPGHIYSQTGRWKDAIAAFDAAGKNELGYMRADRTYGNAHHGHNIRYLVTSHSFDGNYDEAVRYAEHLLQFDENPREKAQVDNTFGAYAQGWFGMLSTLVQFEKWDEILNGNKLPAPSKPRQQAWLHWAQAVAHAAQGNVSEAESSARQFKESLIEFERRLNRKPPAELVTAGLELEGQLEIARGKVEPGLKKLAVASKAERRMRYAEPPLYPRPVLEAMGHIALRKGKGQMAERAFREALEQFPGDVHAQNGLRAAQQQLARPTAAGL
jgi:tetratricopeptide (TPR) repeat protein